MKSVLDENDIKCKEYQQIIHDKDIEMNKFKEIMEIKDNKLSSINLEFDSLKLQLSELLEQCELQREEELNLNKEKQSLEISCLLNTTDAADDRIRV